MDWLAFFTNIVNRVPIERVLFPCPDHTKALEEFARSLPQTESQKRVPGEQKAGRDSETPGKAAQRVSPTIPGQSGLSTEETVAYQSREIGKQQLAMESHYAQRMRIAGRPCNCGQSKHLLYLEEL